MVVAEVQESNVFAAGSRWELRVHPAGDGGSTIDWLTERRPRAVKGRVLAVMLALSGRRYLTRYLRRTLEGLETTAAETGRQGEE